MDSARPGSWSVLIATLATMLAIGRWTMYRGLSYLAAPLTLLVKFMADRYGKEIDAIGKWLKQQVNVIWYFFRRKIYA